MGRARRTAGIDDQIPPAFTGWNLIRGMENKNSHQSKLLNYAAEEALIIAPGTRVE
jgi:hypothetical protein